MYRYISLPTPLPTCTSVLLDTPINWELLFHPRARDCLKNPPSNIREILGRLDSLGHVMIVGSFVQSMLHPDQSDRHPNDIDIQVQVSPLPTDSKVIGTLLDINLPEPDTLPIGPTGWGTFKTASSLVSSPLKVAGLWETDSDTVFGFTLTLSGSLSSPLGRQPIGIDIGIIDRGTKAPIFDFYHHSIGWSYKTQQFEPLISQKSPDSRRNWIQRAIALSHHQYLESSEGSGKSVRSFWLRFAKCVAIGYKAPLLEWRKAIESLQTGYRLNGLSTNLLEQRLKKIPTSIHQSYCLVSQLLCVWGNIPTIASPISVSDDTITQYGQSIIHQALSNPTFTDMGSLKTLLKPNPGLWTPMVWDWMKTNWKRMENHDWILSCWSQGFPDNWKTCTTENIGILDALAGHANHHPGIFDHLVTVAKNKRFMKTIKDRDPQSQLALWAREYDNHQALIKQNPDHPLEELERALRSKEWGVSPDLLIRIGIAQLPLGVFNRLLNKLNIALLDSFKRGAKHSAAKHSVAKHASPTTDDLSVYSLLLDDDYTVINHRVELSKLPTFLYQMTQPHSKVDALPLSQWLAFLTHFRTVCTETAWVQFLLLPVANTNLYTHFNNTLSPDMFSQSPFITAPILPILERELEKQNKSTLAYIINTHRLSDVELFCNALGADYANKGFLRAIAQGSYELATAFLTKCTPAMQIKRNDTDCKIGFRYQLKAIISQQIDWESIPESDPKYQVSHYLQLFQQMMCDSFDSTQEFDSRYFTCLLKEQPELMVVPLRTRYGRLCALDCIDTLRIKHGLEKAVFLTFISDLLVQNSGVIRDAIKGKGMGLSGIVSTMILNPNEKYTHYITSLLDLLARDSNHLEMMSEALLNTRDIGLLFTKKYSKKENKKRLYDSPLLLHTLLKWQAMESTFKDYQRQESLEATSIPSHTPISEGSMRQLTVGRFNIYYSIYCMQGTIENIKTLIRYTIDNPTLLFLCHSQLLKALLGRMIYKSVSETSFNQFQQILIPQINTILTQDILTNKGGVPITHQLCGLIDQLVGLFKGLGIEEPFPRVNWEHMYTIHDVEQVVTETIVLNTDEGLKVSIELHNQQIQNVVLSGVESGDLRSPDPLTKGFALRNPE